MPSLSLDPRALRDRNRLTFRDMVQLGLERLNDHERTCLLAAAESWAKSERAAAVAEFIEARKLSARVDSIGPN